MKKSHPGPSYMKELLILDYSRIRNTMQFKNRKFKFMDSVYTIKFVDKAPITQNQDEDAFNYGVFDPKSKTIYISLKNPDDGKEYPKEHIMQTLRHEIMHMIFLEGQYLSCYDDEPLVEWCAKAIGQLLKVNIFDEKGF